VIFFDYLLISVLYFLLIHLTKFSVAQTIYIYICIHECESIIIRNVDIFMFAVTYTPGWVSLSNPDSAFLSCVSCRKHEIRAASSFLGAEGVPGAYMHRRMPMQCGNSVASQRSVHEWTERFKNGHASVKHQEGAGRPSTSVTDEHTELSPAYTPAKLNCKLHSNYLYPAWSVNSRLRLRHL
jgi:hypothetical protein